MPIQDISILFLISLVAFVNGAVLAWAALLGAPRKSTWLFSLGSFLLAFAPLTVLLVPDSASPWRAAGLNLLPLLSYTCWLLGILHFCNRAQHAAKVLVVVGALLIVVCWLTWVSPVRELRIFLVTFGLAALRVVTAWVLVRHRGALDRRVAWVFAGVLLLEATAMLIRSLTVLLGDMPSIGADATSTTAATWLAVLAGAVLSTPLLMLLGLSRMISDLRHSGMRLQATLNAMPDLVFELDADGRFTALHTSQPELLAVQPEHFLGRLPEDVLPPHVANAARTVMADADRRGHSSGVQYELELPDGLHWFEVSAAVKPATTEGQLPGYVFVTRDISERIRIERMKREFVSVVSHELRTPLTSIAGALDLIISGMAGPLPAQAQQLMEIARRNSQRLRVLIDDLLDMEKLIAGKMRFDIRPQPLQPLLESVIDNTRPFSGGQNISLRLVEPVPAVQVLVDGQRFAQVLSNLLSNAIKFSPAGGDVVIECKKADTHVRISVRDYGPGVPAEFRDRLFEKFSQADGSDSRQKHGSGLGLAIVREMMERMGGTVSYAPAEGGGACFYVELPIAVSF